MKCSLCEERIGFWDRVLGKWTLDENEEYCHIKCLEEATEKLEAEKKRIEKEKKTNKEEKKRLEDAKKVREKILGELDKEDQQTKKVKSNGTRDLLDTQSESEEGQIRAKTSDFVDNQSAGEIDDEIRSEVKDT